MSSVCWACGAEVNAVITVTYPGPDWIDIKPRERRCMPCHEKLAPMDPEHYGKLSEMDLLTMATEQASEDPEKK